MARIRILLALMLALCAIGAATATGAAASPEAKMMKKVNEYRKKHGVRPVKLASSLKHSAKRYADWMMSHHYFGHSSRIHASSRWHRLGEILEIQTGTRPGVKRAFRTWMHSSEHRSIILDGSFTYAGAGRSYGSYEGYKNTFWVMHFGRP